MSEWIFKRDRVIRHVTGRLEALGYRPLQPPSRDDGAENPAYAVILDEFIRQFGGFSAETLEAGMSAFVAEWSYRRWPQVGELRPYMIEAQRKLNPQLERPREKPYEPALPPISEAETQAGFERMCEHDRALGIEPLPRRPSQCTPQERKAYWARVDTALRAKGKPVSRQTSDDAGYLRRAAEALGQDGFPVTTQPEPIDDEQTIIAAG